jgi:MoaA/NifB/PqqE/SkfB family radical SAM enzyme
MCNIWRIPQEIPDLPIDDWLKLLASDAVGHLRELDITGGEPFLRADLADLFRSIGKLRSSSLGMLQSISVTTNGFLVDKVSSMVEQALNNLLPPDVKLVMVCAVDGIGPLHDKIRNTEGAWNKVSATLRELKALREHFPNLIIGIKTTILPWNVHSLGEIAQFARRHDFFTIISPYIITGNRYLNPEKGDALMFTESEIQAMLAFLESGQSQWVYHGQTILERFQRDTVSKPCTCGYNYAFIRYNGEVYLCPLAGDSVGNIHQEGLDTILKGTTARKERQKIGQYDLCPTCTEPGLERYSLPFEGFSYLRMLSKLGKNRFLNMHEHMGLDKYVL